MTLVLFDTNVLAAAICKPDGIAFRLLRIANAGVLIDGLVTDVTGFEFLRICTSGQLGTVFELEEIDEFADAFPRVFASERIVRNAPSRKLSERTDLHDAPVERILVEAYGIDLSEARKALPRAAQKLDPHDLHLAWVAVTAGCDLVCTSDKNVIANLSVCEVARPDELWDALNS